MNNWGKRLTALMLAAVLGLQATVGMAQGVLSLPVALKDIQAEAFTGLQGVEQVILPEGIERIGSRAFAQSSIARINLPQGLTQIAPDAFDGCGPLVVSCAEDSYAEMYALEHDNMEVEYTGEAPLAAVSVAVSSTMCDGAQVEIAWDVICERPQAGDLCALTVMLGDEVYAQFAQSAQTHFEVAAQHDPALTGTMYAIADYRHADGRTTRVTSARTQLTGALRAELEPEDPTAMIGETLTWRLSVEQAAGSVMAQYTVYRDGEEIEERGYVTSTILQVEAEAAGQYTAQAVVSDGLGREIAVSGGAITVGGQSAAEDMLRYALSADRTHYIVVGCNAEAGTVVVPQTRNGLPVSEIAEGAFMACENLTSVSIGSSVERVGAYAFHGCESLTSVTLASSGVQMGEGVFSGCTALGAVPFPAEMKAVPDDYARGCTGLSTLSLPQGVETIGAGAFAGCTGLGALTLPDSVTSIGAGAFSGCTGLASLRAGALVHIGEEAFAGCTRLGSMELGDALQTIGARAFVRCLGLDDVVLPESVRSVGESAFAGCENLKTVLMGNINTSVGEGAFDYCREVEVHTAGAGSVQQQMLEMGVAFRNILLAIVTQAEMLTVSPTVGREMIFSAQAQWGQAPYSYAFDIYADGELTAQSGPQAQSLFAYTPDRPGQYYARITVTDAAGVSAWRETAPCDVAPAKTETTQYLTYALNAEGTGYTITGFTGMPQDGADIVIPAFIEGLPVTAIAYRAAKLNGGILSLTIPDTVQEIGGEAFYGCTNLASVTVGSGTKTIGDRAFFRCGALETLELNYGLSGIGGEAFAQCANLKDFTIPASVTRIGQYAFNGCTALVEMTIPSSVSDCEKAIFYNCTQLKDVTWNAAADALPTLTFYGCTNLDTVTLGYPVKTIAGQAFYLSSLSTLQGRLDAVESVGDYAFFQCTRLEKLRFPAKVERFYIGRGAFEGCTALYSFELNEETPLKPYDNAFYGCTSLSSLTCKYISLYAPNNGAYLGEACFAGCTSLIRVTIEGIVDKRAFENCTGLQVVTLIGTQVIDQSAFRNCSALHTVNMPQIRENSDDIRHKLHVEKYAFQNCVSLPEVVFPQNPYGFSIGAYAFENCTGLERVVLPTTHSNRHIGEGAFRNCTALTTVSNMMSMQSVGDQAFKNCVSLSSVRMSPVPQGGTLPNLFYIGEEAFALCRSLGHLTFDEYTAEIGDNAFAGCTSLSVTTKPDTCASNYFAGMNLGSAAVGALPTTLSAEAQWGAVDNETATVEVTLTIYNTKNGPVPAGENAAELMENSALHNVTVGLQRSDKSRHTVWLEGSGELGTLGYRQSTTVKAYVQCKATPPAQCGHGDLYVSINADSTSASTGFKIEADFSGSIHGDWHITEPTTVSSRTLVDGDIYVGDTLRIDGAALNCTGNVYVCLGGTVKMLKNARLDAKELQIQAGGAVHMDGTGKIAAQRIADAGCLALLSRGCEAEADEFSVTGSGILQMTGDGRIAADVFTFDTATSHASLLTNGSIEARQATLSAGFHATKRHVFVVAGGECLLDVERTSPMQRFASLAIHCEIGNLSVRNISLLGAMPFESEHFALSEHAVDAESRNSNAIGQEIYDKFTLAQMESMREADEELAKALEDWYTVTSNLAKESIDTRADVSQAATIAGMALRRWILERASDSKDKWVNVSDVLGSILSAGTGGAYDFEENGKTYETQVRPLGGLSIQSATASAGTITCKTGSKTYEFTYSLSREGIRRSSKELMTALRKYAEQEYVKQMQKALEEAFGKENVKYAIAVVKVVETSIVEKKTIQEVIAEKYGKTIAKNLMLKMFPKMKKTVDFITKWEKYIKQVDKVNKLIVQTREGDALPTDLMNEFIKLEKLVP